MKILAIRGTNLASFDGTFELDLASGVLGGAGVFAITGPTGAGKTTLLDAMCLALFDRAPRLRNAAAVPVGRGDEDEKLRLRSGDPRSIARRGAAYSEAQVDFAGRDGRRYRAEWSVRRARGRADGRLRDQEVRLVDIETGQALGGTKSETLRAIEERLGLSFEQFCRAALLAQGDFAAFLKAEARERAELLERVTGTEIYGRVSVAVHERAADAARSLEALEARLAAQPPCGEVDRARLEGELLGRDRAYRETREEHDRARKARAWYATLAQRKEDELAAWRALEADERAWTRLSAARAELERIERARPLAPAVEAADRAERAAAQIGEALERARAERDAAAAEGASATEASTLAATLVRQSEQARADARPALAEARRLEPAIDVLVREASERRSQASAAQAEARRVGAVTDGLRADLSAREAERERVLAWLGERSRLEGLARVWSGARTEVERYVEARHERAGAGARRLELRDGYEALRSRLGALRAARDDARRSFDGARASAENAERAAAQTGLDKLAKDREALTSERTQLEALAKIAADARESAARLADAVAGGERAREEQAEARTALDRAIAKHTELDARLAEAEGALRRASAARDLATHRADLIEGEPCPLCGALEHPWAVSAPLDVWIADERARVGDLRAERDGVVAARAQADAHERSAGERAREADERAASLRAEGEQARARFRASIGSRLPARVAGLAPEDARVASELDATRARIDARLDHVATAERAASAAHAAARAARDALDRAREAWDAADARSRDGERDAHEAERALAACAQDEERASRAAARALTALAPVLSCDPAWAPGLEADPDAFVRARDAEMEAWERRRADLATIENDAKALRERIGDAHERAQEARASAERAAAALGEREAQLAALQTQRSKVLGGRTADEVEQELEQRAQSARAEMERASRALEQARSRAAATGKLVEVRESEAAAVVSEKDGALAALAAALDASGVDAATVRALLARDEAWIAERRTEIDALSRSLERSRTVLGERKHQRERHESAGRPSLSEREAETMLANTSAAEDRARRLLVHVEARLREDDARRAHAAALHGEIEPAQRRAEQLAALSRLVGSHDGKKFRVFAQSLTLDMLLAGANGHLRDLAPRYRLMRVPDQDLELQIIDRDMGDEIRGVQSLSGGETFLVSLALALALSSVSARTTRVRSLFIDEGFGTLDLDTLDVALAALDALQATGRQIGLVSHVPGFAERVGAEVVVSPRGGGRSEVRVQLPGAPK